MIDVILSWSGRVWITATVLVMLAIYFNLAGTEDLALFHIGWVPMLAIPNPVNVLWWIAAMIVASPGFGALIIRDKLRKRRR